LTLDDEVNPSSDIMHNVDSIRLIADQIHLELPLDGRENDVPCQPVWEPFGADLFTAGRGWPPYQ